MAYENIIGPEFLLGALGAGMIFALGLIFLAVYIYFALALQKIAKKQNYKNSWFAWIPILNVVLILELGSFHWAWIFLYIGTGIPAVGFLFSIALAALVIVSFWRIFEKENYHGALSLLLLVPIARLIMIGIVAWAKPKKQAKKKSPKKKSSKKKK